MINIPITVPTNTYGQYPVVNVVIGQSLSGNVSQTLTPAYRYGNESHNHTEQSNIPTGFDHSGPCHKDKDKDNDNDKVVSDHPVIDMDFETDAKETKKISLRYKKQKKIPLSQMILMQRLLRINLISCAKKLEKLVTILYFTGKTIRTIWTVLIQRSQDPFLRQKTKRKNNWLRVFRCLYNLGFVS
jgi:hypothetical protein